MARAYETRQLTQAAPEVDISQARSNIQRTPSVFSKQGQLFEKAAAGQLKSAQAERERRLKTAETAKKEAEKEAEKTMKLARDTYQEAAKSESTRMLNELFITHPNEPETLKKEFDKLRQQLLKNVPDMQAQMEIATDFENTAMPLLRKAAKNNQKRVNISYKNTIRDSVLDTKRYIEQNADLLHPVLRGQDPEAASALQVQIQGLKNKAYAKDINGEYVLSDSQREEVFDFVENGVFSAMQRNYFNDLVDDDLEKARVYAEDFKNQQAQHFNVSVETKKKLDNYMDMFLKNPTQDAQTLMFKESVNVRMEEFKNMEKDIEKEVVVDTDNEKKKLILNKVNTVKELRQALDSGLVGSNDKQIIKQKIQLQSEIGNDVIGNSLDASSLEALNATLDREINKGETSILEDIGDWWRSNSVSNDNYLKGLISENSQNNKMKASNMYIELSDKFTPEELSSDDDSIKYKIREAVKELNKKQIETFVSPPVETNAVITTDGILQSYSEEASATGKKVGN